MRSWKLLSTINGGHKRSVRCVGWKDYGGYMTKKRKTNETDEEEDENAAGKRDPVLLATGSFDANAGLWVWNRSHNSGSGQSRQRLPGAFDDDDYEQERDFTNAAEEDENEEWHFSTLLTGPDSEIKDVKFSPAHYGATLLATCSRDKSVWVWEEVEPEEWETIAVMSEHQGDVKCLAWCQGGQTTRKELQKRLERRQKAGSSTNTEQGQEAMDVDTTNGPSDNGDSDNNEQLQVGSRELLASGSYDDTIRLYHDDESEGDWICIAVLTGHEGTVWDLKFEPYISLSSYTPTTTAAEILADWTPRLASCSDDLTIRIWRKQLNDKERVERQSRIEAAKLESRTDLKQPERQQRQTGFSGPLPSTMRVSTSTETWIQESKLPLIHLRSIYALDWSTRTGLIVSCGGDGLIVVYREVTSPTTITDSSDTDITMSNAPSATQYSENGDEEDILPKLKTEWKVVTAIEAAHDEYEVNHVCWAGICDSRNGDGGDEDEGEEYIISTGDEGDVRVWKVPSEVLSGV